MLTFFSWRKETLTSCGDLSNEWMNKYMYLLILIGKEKQIIQKFSVKIIIKHQLFFLGGTLVFMILVVAQVKNKYMYLPILIDKRKKKFRFRKSITNFSFLEELLCLCFLWWLERLLWGSSLEERLWWLERFLCFLLLELRRSLVGTSSSDRLEMLESLLLQDKSRKICKK